MTVITDPANGVKSTNNTSTANIGGTNTLNGAIDSSVDAIVVNSTDEFPSSGTIKIESEYITYASLTGGTSFQGCVRGAFNTVAASHSGEVSVVGVYIGTPELNTQPDVMVSLKSGTVGTEYFDFSNVDPDANPNDPTIWDTFPSNGFDVGTFHEFHTAVKGKRYFRVRFEHSSTTQITNFRVSTYFGVFRQGNLPLNQDISDDADSIVVRSVIVGKNDSGTYSNIRSTNNNELRVRSTQQDIFGININTMYTPIIQSYQLYGITAHTQLYDVYTANGGTITTSSDGNSTVMSCNTTLNSYATLRSKRILKYRSGYSLVCKIAAKFDSTTAAGSLQFAGVGNAQSDLYFCYNGTDFGIRYSTGGQLEIRALTISTAANTTQTGTVTLNSVAYNVNLTNSSSSTIFTAHQIEVGNSFGGLWSVEHIGSVIYFIASNVGARSGTYSFTSTGAAVGSFAQTRAGASLTTTNITQTSWNGWSDMIASLDPAKNNMYEIDYSWYGTGNIDFRIYNPSSSRYETVHTLTFANSATSPSISAPNMYIQRGVASITSTTALSMTTMGVFGCILGKIDRSIGPISAVSNTKSITTNIETVVLVVKNRLHINGYANQSEIYLDGLVATTDGTQPVTFCLYKNPTTLSANTTTDYTNYQYVNQNQSLVLYDTESDTFTGGTVLFKFTLSKEDSNTFDLLKKEYYIGRSDTFIITALSTSTSSVTTVFNLLEDY